MPLKLTINSYQRLSPGQEPAKIVEQGSLSIGRAPKNDWVLEDPERILSSQHCLIHYKDGAYILTDVSTNGTFLNDAEERIPRNQVVELQHGDTFTLGEYEIGVHITSASIAPADEDEDDGPVTDIAPAIAALPPTPIMEVIAPRLGGGDSQDQPTFNDLLADDTPAAGDGLGLPNASLQTPLPNATEPSADFSHPEGAVYEPPDILLPAPPPQPEAPAPGAAVRQLIPDNWWELPPAGSTAPLAPSPPVAPDPPLAPPPATLPTPLPAAMSPPAAPATPAPPASADTPALFAAFLQGATLATTPLSAQQQLEAFKRLGAVFRATVQGLMEMLLARGDVKSEFRLDRTHIGPMENNPLKTPPGQTPLAVDEVMKILLIGGHGAYMPALQAVSEGFNDIKLHELALVAGIQAALARLLTRFDPQQLETRLEQSILDNLWAANRKAKYWDLFIAEYRAIAREAEDDFNELFGAEFARAYQDQVRSG